MAGLPLRAWRSANASSRHCWMFLALACILVALHGAAAETSQSPLFLRKCGETKLDTAQAKQMLEFEDIQYKATGKSSPQINFRMYFPVVFHVFESLNDNITVPEPVIMAQIDHANKAFSSVVPDSNIRFTLKGIERYTDVGMAWGCLNTAYNGALFHIAKADQEALHVFVCNTASSPSEAVAGLARLPCHPDSQLGDVFDGVMWLHYRAFPTVPGVYEGTPMFDEGDTFVHEMGHVFGLLHTFQDSAFCQGPGDMISDTPVQRVPGDMECNTQQDSCPQSPGRDPVQNYMDYSPDSCMNHFTPLQIARMQSEIQRCLSNRYVRVEQTITCKSNGGFGPARGGAVCKNTKCNQGRTPAKKNPPKNAPWCHTQGGSWGGPCVCSSHFIEPTASPTLVATSQPSSRPTKSPTTSRPSVGPTDRLAFAIERKRFCGSYKGHNCPEECEVFKVARSYKLSLPKPCREALGCRAQGDAFCTGFCRRLCSHQRKRCTWVNDRCTAL